MAQTNINIRIDKDLKEEFDTLCTELGLTMTTAFNIFAKTMVRQQRIPFEVSKHMPNQQTIEAMNEVREMIKNPDQEKSYTSVEEMMKDIVD